MAESHCNQIKFTKLLNILVIFLFFFRVPYPRTSGTVCHASQSLAREAIFIKICLFFYILHLYRYICCYYMAPEMTKIKYEDLAIFIQIHLSIMILISKRKQPFDYFFSKLYKESINI